MDRAKPEKSVFHAAFRRSRTLASVGQLDVLRIQVELPLLRGQFDSVSKVQRSMRAVAEGGEARWESVRVGRTGHLSVSLCIWACGHLGIYGCTWVHASIRCCLCSKGSEDEPVDEGNDGRKGV